MNNEGYTALHLSITKGSFVSFTKILVKMLTLAGCDITQKTPLGLDPIHLAAQNDFPHLLAYFSELGISVESPDSKGGTPLHWSAYLGSYYSTSLLLALNVSLDTQDHEGQTPLILATISGNSRVARLLLLKGADKSVKDNKKRTALDIALSKNSQDFKEMLKEFGILEIYGYRPLFKPYKKNYLPFMTLIVLETFAYLLLAAFCFPCKLYLDSNSPTYVYSISSLFVIVLVIILININPGYVENSTSYTLSVIFK